MCVIAIKTLLAKWLRKAYKTILREQKYSWNIPPIPSMDIFSQSYDFIEEVKIKLKLCDSSPMHKKA